MTTLDEFCYEDSLFVLINIYNANNEPDQRKSLIDLGEILYRVDVIKTKTVFGSDFNVSFYYFHEAQWVLEKTHFSKNNSNKGKAQLC